MNLRIQVAGVALERIGRYRVDHLLGAGAFATVWLAYDELLDAAAVIVMRARSPSPSTLTAASRQVRARS